MNVLRSALIALAVFALQSIAFGQSADESAKPPDGSPKQDEVGTGSGDANSEAPPPAAAQTSSGTDLRESMCLMIESGARANGLPLEFFARVIWQESRFQSARAPALQSGGLDHRDQPLVLTIDEGLGLRRVGSDRRLEAGLDQSRREVLVLQRPTGRLGDFSITGCGVPARNGRIVRLHVIVRSPEVPKEATAKRRTS
jgi:hypothetical protein